MGMGPAAVPHVQDKIERVVADVNVRDAIVAYRQQQGFDRRPFAARRLETEQLLVMLLPPNSAAHPVSTSRPLNPRPAGLSIVTSGAIVVFHRSSS
jgi:hypothetical protein